MQFDWSNWSVSSGSTSRRGFGGWSFGGRNSSCWCFSGRNSSCWSFRGWLGGGWNNRYWLLNFWGWLFWSASLLFLLASALTWVVEMIVDSHLWQMMMWWWRMIEMMVFLVFFLLAWLNWRFNWRLDWTSKILFRKFRSLCSSSCGIIIRAYKSK